MVDSVAGNAISTLLRAQNVVTSETAVALKNNKQAAKAIMAQLQEGAPTSLSSVEQITATGTSLSTMGTTVIGSNLPRGSLVDLLV